MTRVDRRRWLWPSVACVTVVLSPWCRDGLAAPAVDPAVEERAIRAAVERVAPSTVRIEVVGLAAEGEAAAGAGPSTGLIVGADGWIVTTSFAVTKETVEVLVVLPDGTRRAAKVVGRDVARTIVLLKIDPPAPLPVPATAALSDLRVGQWSIALGRAWSASQVSVSVGVISAFDRGWGRAVQTDAAVSPANYGGPLVDIRGRVIGVLAPIPADTAGMNVGTELYDSGIGFAVPMEDIGKRLAAMKAGETILPGLLGITYSSRDLFTHPPVIATVRAGSPAAKAGLRTGDRIVAADGRDVTRIAEFRHGLSRHSAGESMRLSIARRSGGGEDRFDREITLVGELPAYRRPSLGIGLERRTRSEEMRDPPRVAWLWPEGPAAKAGLMPGDRILSIAAAAEEAGAVARDAGDARSGDATADAATLAAVVAGSEIGGSLRVRYVRGGEQREVAMITTAFPEGLPPESLVLPAPGRFNAGKDGGNDQRDEQKNGADGPAIKDADENDADDGDAARRRRQGGVERLGGPDVADPPLVVMPADDGRQIGLLVLLGGGRIEREAVAARWRAAADASGVAVVLPASSNPARWTADDVPGIGKAIQAVAIRRPVDRSRVAVAGMQAGGGFAWTVAESLGNAIRGVAILDGGLPPRATVAPADPGRPLSVVLARPRPDAVDADAARRRVEKDAVRLDKAGIPVGVLTSPAVDPIPHEAVCRWVETLGML